MIELTVVVLILAILAAVAIPEYIGMRRKAQYAEGYVMLGEINKQQNSYFAFYDSYSHLKTLGYGPLDYYPEIPSVIPEVELYYAKYFGFLAFSPADDLRISSGTIACPKVGGADGIFGVLTFDMKCMTLHLQRGVMNEMLDLPYGAIFGLL